MLIQIRDCRRDEGRLDTDCGELLEELLRCKKRSALFRGNSVAGMMRRVPGRSLRMCKCGRGSCGVKTLCAISRENCAMYSMRGVSGQSSWAR
jgi:hypothetical protein